MDRTLQNLCRLCAQERIGSIDIFMKTEDNILLCEVIENVLNISISQGDTIPCEICTKCHTFLLNFLKFREIAEKTQLFLVNLEINLEKEKKTAKHELNQSIETIKSEPSTTHNEVFDATSSLSLNSVDDIYSQKSKSELSLTQTAIVSTFGSPENFEDATSQHSFTWDEENIPLIKVAALKSTKKECYSDEDQCQKYDVDNQQSAYNALELRIENPLNNPEECNICQKKFTKERYLRHHLRKTHKVFIEANYPCSRCPRKFMQKLSLERHQKLHDDPNFNTHVTCNICGKFYINKQTLKTHIRSIHIDIGKKFVCEECGAQFKGISSLKTHKITHTGEYPFECKKCDRRFQSKANLFVHLDTHTETPYVCEICHKPSTTLRGLRLHMVNHSDEKPHKCHMCGNAYKRVTALKKHLIVHSGIRPYSCNFCERTFADGSNKRIHMRRVHKKELAEMEAAGMKVMPTVLPKIQHLREDGVTVQG